MTTPWGFEDFDAHEDLHFVSNEECGLKAIIAVHSTHLGPAAGRPRRRGRAGRACPDDQDVGVRGRAGHPLIVSGGEVAP